MSSPRGEHSAEYVAKALGSRPFSEIPWDPWPDPWWLHAQAMERPKRNGQHQRIKHHCERCDFIPEHSSQLDIHNHKLPIEEQVVLCANCHRLITAQERGWL